MLNKILDGEFQLLPEVPASARRLLAVAMLGLLAVGCGRIVEERISMEGITITRAGAGVVVGIELLDGAASSEVTLDGDWFRLVGFDPISVWVALADRESVQKLCQVPADNFQVEACFLETNTSDKMLAIVGETDFASQQALTDHELIHRFFANRIREIQKETGVALNISNAKQELLARYWTLLDIMYTITLENKLDINDEYATKGFFDNIKYGLFPLPQDALTKDQQILVDYFRKSLDEAGGVMGNPATEEILYRAALKDVSGQNKLTKIEQTGIIKGSFDLELFNKYLEDRELQSLDDSFRVSR